VTPKDHGVIATGINGRGEMVGFEWVDDKEHPGMEAQAPILAKGKSITVLPLLKGYTATFPAALSDGGIVVGRVSKPAPRGVFVPLRNQGFSWEAQFGIRAIGPLEGDHASFACGITRDGRRISGYSVGENRVRACVWDRAGEIWKGSPLPQEGRLASNVVPISDDGKRIAAVDGTQPCLWSQDSSGAWKREAIAEAGTLVPRAVNNAGTVAGLRYTNEGTTHAAFWSRDGGYKQIDEPTGYITSEANAVNNLGVIVGTIDGRAGTKYYPRAFAYERGRLRLLTEGGSAFAGATAINDRGQVAGIMETVEEEQERKAAERGEKQR
jgi:uncharacterized membrane protein